jgi:hypothetical protein
MSSHSHGHYATNHRGRRARARKQLLSSEDRVPVRVREVAVRGTLEDLRSQSALLAQLQKEKLALQAENQKLKGRVGMCFASCFFRTQLYFLFCFCFVYLASCFQMY